MNVLCKLVLRVLSREVLTQLRLAVHEVAFECALNIWLHVPYLVSRCPDVFRPSLAPEIVGKRPYESFVFGACRAFHHRIDA